MLYRRAVVELIIRWKVEDYQESKYQRNRRRIYNVSAYDDDKEVKAHSHPSLVNEEQRPVPIDEVR